jgi:uncharacterized protein YjbI with pentapeptide repeats
MNDETSPEKTDLSKVPEGKKKQTNDKPSATEPNEFKQQLLESFKKICDRSNKFSHECDLKREAKKLDMEVEEYRRWYELSSKPPTWRSRFWHWTGFGEKKLWDVLQLIIVPVILAGGAYYLQDTAKQREQVQQDVAKESEQTAAIEKANQNTLIMYLEQMAELLQKGLLKTKTNSETFIIAQAKTVITLQSLDPKRQHLVIQFLDAANLNTLDGEKGILYKARMSEANLNKADLSRANLFEANLSYANLSYANLSNANLSNAILSGADLSNANLFEAKLSGAKLRFANLSYANLSEADLRDTDLSGAKLSGAYLGGAKLSGANLSKANLYDEARLFQAETLSEVQLQLLLAQVKLCNTTLPDGKVSNRDCSK